MGPLRMRLRNYLQVLAFQWLLHYWLNPVLHADKSSSDETPADIPGTLIQKCICLFTVNLTWLLDTENDRLKIWMKHNCINIFVSCWRIWSSDKMFKEAVVAQLMVPPRVVLREWGKQPRTSSEDRRCPDPAWNTAIENGSQKRYWPSHLPRFRERNEYWKDWYIPTSHFWHTACNRRTTNLIIIILHEELYSSASPRIHI
jgi:hypothetical protein